MPSLSPEQLDTELDALEVDLADDDTPAKALPPATNRSQLDALQLDEQIFDGGPTRAQVEAYKVQYPHSKLLCVLLADGFGVLYRTLTRTEWKVIQKTLAKTEETDQREEFVFAKIVLSPNCDDHSVIGSLPAGIVPTVMSEFYSACGFQTAVSSLQL